MNIEITLKGSGQRSAITLADLRDFVRLCEQQEVPDHCVFRVETVGFRGVLKTLTSFEWD